MDGELFAALRQHLIKLDGDYSSAQTQTKEPGYVP
jgi:hypothetical protein